MKRIYLAFAAILFSAMAFAQGTLTGTVTDGDQGGPLPGASVMVKGTSIGTSTDFDGNFTLEVSQSSGILVVSYIGFLDKEVSFSSTGNVGTIVLMPDAQELGEVVVTGVMDIAKERETPVAVSTIRASEIVEKLGAQEFPEILRSTPSIYVTKQGGGFGDARINVRGFDQRNTAVMINGVPVNDMENGWVYWSNWAGLSDVTSAMQVQRGLGSSKLAISSVGGTINILTKAADNKEGGAVAATLGNNDYLKTTVSYNTGLMENGLSVSAMFGRSAGDGYVQGTPFEAYNYFVALGYRPNDKHDFQFMVTGAPQQHFQRGYAESISNYIRYGNNGVDPNIRYNSDYGYRNGKEDTFSGNFYHKPKAMINWDWKMSDKSTLSSVVYASLGRGGSIGSIGRINGGQSYSGQFKDANGHVRIDDIIAWNSGANIPDFGVPREGYTGGGNPMYQGMFVNGNANSYGFVDEYGFTRGPENGISQRSSMNSHNWFGTIINFHNDVNENWSFDLGVDARTYKGIHYRRLVDLMGADVYVDNDDINNTYNFTTNTYAPTIGNIWNVFKNVDDETKIDYYNDGKVQWLGAFGQVEYKTDKISAFLQGGISNQGFKRIDYFNYLDSDPEQETDWVNIVGGNIKGGLNYNINEKHNVFANAGYYLKQPIFDAIFLNFVNDINENYQNEKILGVEVGYGFRSQFFSANVNLYRTSWSDRYLTDGVTITDDQGNQLFQGTANYDGVEQVHMGVEVDFTARPSHWLTFTGMLSLGNWEYSGNPLGTVYDDGQNEVGQANIILDGQKVDDAAQTTMRLGATIEPVENLFFDASWYHAADLYAQFDVLDLQDQDSDGQPDGGDFQLKLPAYDLFDAGLSYRMTLGKEKSKYLNLRLNVNNVFNEVYISEATSNREAEAGDETWNGVNVRNNVFWGFGRTWNVGLRYRF
ncbi:TonB-dependent receptor [Flagellimonas zhangzhouensis]|uniref:TonB-dependent Receptor Plug Domain n=1 Tax=Flagellimonas zhangzhouensis TaxID=1073328 RepID=A0A1H2V728_9FLAO|nr:carboxypeptidase-like regulatory domain-containing protein [Allomuricauda zhangzhouensis]SDQ10190.1 TonB-dependent Receptor Plug Domain [Allomuricauda zhangzhouensis]SDW64105.1 TonB-dependent Receptor Plug Domain [Allomuricauda zhangzhouensis]